MKWLMLSLISFFMALVIVLIFNGCSSGEPKQVQAAAPIPLVMPQPYQRYVPFHQAGVPIYLALDTQTGLLCKTANVHLAIEGDHSLPLCGSYQNAVRAFNEGYTEP